MAVFTLTTDLGYKDHYLAAAKGEILKRQSEATLIDISAEVPFSNVRQAAFILQQAWHHFPAGTIHLVSVGARNPRYDYCVAFEHEGHYFFGIDNGLFSLVFEEVPREVFKLREMENSLPNYLLRVLIPAACELSAGTPFSEFADPFFSLRARIRLNPPETPGSIRVVVEHVDIFGNLILNLSRQRFEALAEGKRIHIQFRRSEFIELVSTHYTDVEPGERLCLFNSDDFLEIAINQGNASRLLGLKVDDVIQIDFS